MLFTLAYPVIDPVLLHIGPIAIRWYGLAYAVGLAAGWWYMRKLVVLSPAVGTLEAVDDFLFWALLGVVLGGRTGYVLFYNFDYFMARPSEIFKVWHGGMSFHGGLLGVVIATVLFTRRHKIPLMAFGDRIACVAPIGLFFGRIANFINGELYGRPTDVPWAMVFPRGGPLPRHPSQIYEALLEGVLLFLILNVLSRSAAIRARTGTLMGVFLLGYGLARTFAEFFREPDVQIGFLDFGTTMGQWLSAPMILIGIGLIWYAGRARWNKTQ